MLIRRFFRLLGTAATRAMQVLSRSEKTEGWVDTITPAWVIADMLDGSEAFARQAPAEGDAHHLSKSLFRHARPFGGVIECDPRTLPNPANCNLRNGLLSPRARQSGPKL